MSPQDIRIVGVHPVPISEQEFDEAVEWMWGSDLHGRQLDEARANTRQHFDGLRLIEIEVTPPDAEVDWMSITQPNADLPCASWQVPYLEEVVDEMRGAWAFYLHYVNSARPLHTELGERLLPATTPAPPHLAGMKYETP